MANNTLSVFTNFRINDDERFIRMKDSFHSYKSINATKWVVNVRGEYSTEVLSFLSEHLGDKLCGHSIESGRGWFHDSRLLLDEIQSDYVLYWVEDHLNMASVEKYDAILQDMTDSESQFLFTSWWFFDQGQNAYEGLPTKSYPNIDTVEVDIAGARKITKKVGLHFIISALGIFKTQLFKKVVNKNHPLLRRWPKETPFDFEKRVTDYYWLPIKVSLPKFELFAPIDDDLRGYRGSLQSRGLYPLRVLRNSGITDTTTIQNPIAWYYHLIPKPVQRIFKKFVLNPYYFLRQFLKRLSYHL